MKLTAAQAKERILSGNIKGNHEVIENLDMTGSIIPAWPNWKFLEVNLYRADIKKVSGTFVYLNCTDSSLEEIDASIQISKKDDGLSACFMCCKKLSKVQGNFEGLTIWNHSGIREINPATKFGISNEGDSAYFDGCVDLLKAQGCFPGYTNWSNSTITSIDKTTSFGKNKHNASACFIACHNLKEARGQFPGGTYWGNSGIETIDPDTKFGIDNHGVSADFVFCQHLRPVTYAEKPKGTVMGAPTFTKKTIFQGIDF